MSIRWRRNANRFRYGCCIPMAFDRKLFHAVTVGAGLQLGLLQIEPPKPKGRRR